MRSKNLGFVFTIILLVTIFAIMPAIALAKKKKKVVEPPPIRPANGSLFTDDGRNVELFGDFKPRRIGDIVFVDVVEDSSASVTTSAKNSRESGSLGGAIIAAAPVPTAIAAGAGSVVGALGTRKFDGKGSTERKSTLRARIAARVVEVLPNGDLRIEAQKRLKINKEDERLTLTGIVRPRDIAVDSAVPSTAVADLRVQLNGKGVASAHSAPGWLTRILGKIAPF
ncbi:MAG: flagellar basal body L-ring protein FlgH [Acidobacteriota bacterium]